MEDRKGLGRRVEAGVVAERSFVDKLVLLDVLLEAISAAAGNLESTRDAFEEA